MPGKTRKPSVLRRQHPKSAARRGRDVRRRRRILVALGLLAAVVATYRFGWQTYKKTLASTFFQRHDVGGPSQIKPIAWQVDLKLTTDQPLNLSERDEIVSTAQSLLGSGSTQELTNVARAIQGRTSYADVSVIKIAPTGVAVQVRPRTPIMCVEADQLRMITTAGEVYGQIPDSHFDSCPGPVLSGIFNPGGHLPLRHDLTVSLTQEEQLLIQQSIELLHAAQGKNLQLRKIFAQKYRGFFFSIPGEDVEVAIGNPPFAPKMTKLQGILEKLAQRHEHAQRIELDYQGKAFIKLKKM